METCRIFKERHNVFGKERRTIFSLTVKSKLWLVTVFILLSFIMITLITNNQLGKLSQLQDEAYRRSQDANYAQKMAGVGEELYRIIADTIINENIETSKSLWIKRIDEVEIELKSLLDISDTGQEEKWINETENIVENMDEIYINRLLPGLQGKVDNFDIKQLDEKIDNDISTINTLMNSFSESLLAEAVDADVEFDQERTNTINFLIVLSVIIIILLTLTLYFIIKSITKPLDTASKFAKKIGNGDLTIEKINYNKDDEIGTLINSLNTMFDNLKEIISVIYDYTEKLSNSSNELSDSGSQVGTTAEQVALAIENVASGAEEQSAKLGETSKNVHELAQRINEIDKKTIEMDSSSDDVIESIENGNNSLQDSIAKIYKVKEDTSEISNIIRSLGNNSEEVGKIVSLISDIADQTNLLALNAAIEAARAGEAGRGFSVVADEIRQLAEGSIDATTQITSMIKQIQSGVNEAVIKMEENDKSVEDSSVAIKSTEDVFDTIMGLSRDLKNIIQLVAANTEQVSDYSNSVQTSIDEITAVSQEFAGTSEEVAASSEEQIASTEEIISSAKQLSNMAVELSEVVKKFKLDN